MKKNIWLLVFALAFFLRPPVWAAESTPYSSQKSPILEIKKGKSYPLCKELSQILQLPENKDYLKNGNVTELFYIPLKNKNFKGIKWSSANEEDFKNNLPRDYDNFFYLLEKEYSKNPPTTTIEKMDIDVYNRGIKNTLFRIKSQNYWNIYMLEPDRIRVKFKQIFDDEASNSNPFYYKGRAYFSYLRKGVRFDIIEFGYNGQGNLPVVDVCRFKF